MEAAKGRRGRPRRVRVIEVRCADPSAYAKISRISDNPFDKMDAEKRTNEIVLLLAHIWAETCREMARDGTQADRRSIAA